MDTYAATATATTLVTHLITGPLNLTSQPVVRCLATDITQPGWHKWETSYAANPNDAGLVVDWPGAFWAEARVP